MAQVTDEQDRDALRRKLLAGGRVSRGEAAALFAWDLPEMGRLADERRRMVFPHERVGFIIDRIINFTNVCEAACRFCAYHARAGAVEPYELSMGEILQKVEELLAAGGTQVMLQGGLHPEYTLDTYAAMVRAVKERFPSVYLHSFSPAEAAHMAAKSGLSIDDAVGRLKEAGLDSMPGASDILVDRVRRVACPGKLSVAAWEEVMRALARHGMKSSATMTYGMGETPEERVEHLDVIRRIQDETGVIRAFIPWSFSPARTGMDKVIPATGMDYLRVVAVSRVYLDNVVFMQAGWLTEGLELAQIALTMGANDMGGVLTEEVVVKATGITARTSRDELVAVIRDAGKSPVQRDSDYRVIRVFD
jgi:cyclic dehypoxanthinyl futalosine synthase